eukprot:gene10289-biopygen18278
MLCFCSRRTCQHTCTPRTCLKCTKKQPLLNPRTIEQGQRTPGVIGRQRADRRVFVVVVGGGGGRANAAVPWLQRRVKESPRGNRYERKRGQLPAQLTVMDNPNSGRRHAKDDSVAGPPARCRACFGAHGTKYVTAATDVRARRPRPTFAAGEQRLRTSSFLGRATQPTIESAGPAPRRRGGARRAGRAGGIVARHRSYNGPAASCREERSRERRRLPPPQCVAFLLYPGQGG